MSAYFVDLDGTLFEFGTNILLPGARDFLNFIKKNGHQLILTTRRGDEWEPGHVFSEEDTLKALKDLNIEYDNIIFKIDSPRIIVNDTGCLAINVITNEGIRKGDYEIKGS